MLRRAAEAIDMKNEYEEKFATQLLIDVPNCEPLPTLCAPELSQQNELIVHPSTRLIKEGTHV